MLFTIRMIRESQKNLRRWRVLREFSKIKKRVLWKSREVSAWLWSPSSRTWRFRWSPVLSRSSWLWKACWSVTRESSLRCVVTPQHQESPAPISPELVWCGWLAAPCSYSRRGLRVMEDHYFAFVEIGENQGVKRRFQKSHVFHELLIELSSPIWQVRRDGLLAQNDAGGLLASGTVG
jgi:hypothetical protein